MFLAQIFADKTFRPEKGQNSRFKRWLVPDVIEYASLPLEVTKFMTGGMVASLGVSCLLLVTSVLVSKLFFVFFFFALIFTAWFYFAKVRPFLAGKVITVTGEVFEDSQKKAQGRKRRFFRQRSTARRKVTLLVEDNYCDVYLPVRMAIPPSSTLVIYTTKDAIVQQNDNTYSLLHYLTADVKAR